MIIATSQNPNDAIVTGAMTSGASAYQRMFATGAFVLPGETLFLYHYQTNDYCYYNISGYYTH